MEQLDRTNKLLKSLSAGTSGQVHNVRTIMGRQLLFHNSPTKLHLLPSIESTPLQNIDPESEDFGNFIFMVGVDSVDGGAPIK